MSEQHTLDLHLRHLSGELTPEQERFLREHHAECRSCRLDLQRLRSSCELYDSLDAPAPPPALLADLRRRAKAELRFTRRWRFIFQSPADLPWLQAFATATVIVLLAILVASLPKRTTTPAVEPVYQIAGTPDFRIAELQQQMVMLDQGDIRPGTKVTERDRSDALIDEELKNIRKRMNRLARQVLAD
jgi:anti-sigma factor RsiW